MEKASRRSDDKAWVPSILVLYDDEEVLASMKSLFRKFPCNFRFFNSMDIALKELRAGDVDVIISELRMRENNGVQFMKEAAAIAPYAKRILVSEVEDKSVLVLALSNGLINHYLHIPWEEFEFIQLISKCVEAKISSSLPSDRDVLYEFEEIPSPPRFQERLNRILSDLDAPVSKIIEEIELNPALVARLLRIANSVYLGIRKRVTSIREAVLFVGTEYIASIVTALEAFHAYSSKVPPRYAGLLEELSVAAVQRAMYTREISAKLNGLDDKYVAHVASLLQDIGIFARVCLRPAAYDEFLRTMDELKIGPREAELKVFGNVAHERISAAILDNWNFPQEIVETVRMHHSEKCSNDYVRIVQIAMLIGRRADGYPFDEALLEIVPVWEARLGLLEQDRIQEIKARS